MGGRTQNPTRLLGSDTSTEEVQGDPGRYFSLGTEGGGVSPSQFYTVSLSKLDKTDTFSWFTFSLLPLEWSQAISPPSFPSVSSLQERTELQFQTSLPKLRENLVSPRLRFPFHRRKGLDCMTCNIQGLHKQKVKGSMFSF